MGIQRTFSGLQSLLLVVQLLGATACTQEPQVGGFGDVLPRWRLSAEPLAVIGFLDEPAHVLDGVVGGLLLPDRRPHRGTRPRFTEVYLDHIGRTWLGALSLPGDSTRAWTIFNPALEPEATIALPTGAKILDIGADRILLLVRNELDVEHDRMYRLLKN